jgi:outer membrane protein assembly factor BamB
MDRNSPPGGFASDRARGDALETQVSALRPGKRALAWCCLAGGALLLMSGWGPGAAPSAEDNPPPHTWPTFGGTPARNMVNRREKNLPVDWAVEGGKLRHVRWVAELGTRAYGGPVVAGGRVYVGTNNERPRDPKITGPKAVLLCFRAQDGQFLWQAVHDMPPPHIVTQALKDGLCSTPTVDGDRLYYVTPACVVVCAEAASGKTIWQFDLMKELKVYPDFLANCSPLVVGERVFVVTGNGVDDTKGQLPSPEAPSFVALNKQNGKLLWQSNLPGKNIIEGQWSNPAYARLGNQEQVIFPGGDGYLYGLEPATGRLIWKFNCNPPRLDPGNKLPNYILATPVVYRGRVYVGTGLYPEHPAGNRVGHFWCVRLDKKGDASPKDSAFDPQNPLNRDSALVWHFGGRLRSAASGEREVLLGRTLSTAAVHDGLVYVAEESGYLHCLDAETGKEYWQHDLKAGIWGSPYWADGKVYLGTEDGDIAIFAHGRQKRLLATINMDEPIKTTPVAVDGVLYVMTDSHLYAIGEP